jgi:hypothetical protein
MHVTWIKTATELGVATFANPSVNIEVLAFNIFHSIATALYYNITFSLHSGALLNPITREAITVVQ